MTAATDDLAALPWQRLPLEEGVVLAWCDGGDPQGWPVVVLHGGPGGRTRAPSLQWWHGLPVRWIAYDQRGCGRSTPRGGLAGNDLPTLLDDLDRLRRHLGLAHWAVAGGSWGALLALAYAAQWPQAVSGLFLRSRFTGSEAELRRYMAPWRDWLGASGRAALGPAAEALPRWLCRGGSAGCDDLARDVALARAWGAFDAAQAAPGGIVAAGARWQPSGAAVGLEDWRIFLHHAARRFGVGPRGVVVPESPPGPVMLVHGAADAVCDPAGSLALAAAWPAADCRIVEGGAHAMGQAAMAAALRAAAQAWVGRLTGG